MPFEIRFAIEQFATVAAREFHLLQMDLADVRFQNVHIRKRLLAIFAYVGGRFGWSGPMLLIVMNTKRSFGEETVLFTQIAFVSLFPPDFVQ